MVASIVFTSNNYVAFVDEYYLCIRFRHAWDYWVDDVEMTKIDIKT